jgi:colanic acid/amylovoran biosynthesis glycosyltransferase
VRVAYLVSQYPALSHSFIRREVRALRRKGIQIETFSVRRAPQAELIAEADREEAAATRNVLPATLERIVVAHLRALVTRPGRYLATLRAALTERPPGARALLWSLFYFGEAIVLASMLADREISHLHVHFANPGADVGGLAARFLGISWSLTLHGTCDFEFPAIATLGAKLRSAEFAACASGFLRAQALRTIPARLWDRVFVVRCGLELSEYPIGERRSPSETLRVLCVARLSEEKGHLGLLDAFGRLIDSGVAADLRLVGDGPERRVIETRVAALGLGERVVLAGPLAGAELSREFERADVFALASLMEGLPVTLMEAMAHGIPVVAPGLGGIPELVRHERVGLLFEPGDWAGLARALARMATDPELRERMGKRGRERVEAHHDVERAVEPLFERFAARSPAPEGRPGSAA